MVHLFIIIIIIIIIYIYSYFLKVDTWQTNIYTFYL